MLSIFDDIDEIGYIKKYANILTNQNYRDFYSPDLMRREIEVFEDKIFSLDKNDPAYEARLSYLERKKAEDLNAVNSFEKNTKSKKKGNSKLMMKKLARVQIQGKKMLIEFNNAEAASLKSIAVKKKSVVKTTTRFMSGKLLMFTKLSIRSFIYSLVEIFSFPNETVQEIYKKYQIEKIFCYHTLTDTDSISLQFVIISYPSSTFPEFDVRDILFEIIVKTEMFQRFDTSHSFWKKLDAQKPKRQKKLGLYEVENIDDPCYVTLAINTKEYFEFFKSSALNKKHKGIKKGVKGIDYEHYAERIKSLKNFETFEQPKNEYKQIMRFAVKKGDMVTTNIVKTKFSQLNNKRFYVPNGILSLPFGHPSLKKLDEFKNEKGQKTEKYFWEGKRNF